MKDNEMQKQATKLDLSVRPQRSTEAATASDSARKARVVVVTTL
jgi:hypothetical protein